MKANHPSKTDPKRPYRQGARAEASARTTEAIVDAFARFLETEWYNDVSLERIAQEAGTTVQTVLRHFGSKEGILDGVRDRVEREVMGRRNVAPGQVDAAIAVITEDYEIAGDMMLRFLAQEDRVPAIRALTDFGRASHRRWVRKTFAPYFENLPQERQEWLNDGLVVALDIYVWKLLRRDRGRSAEDVRTFMKTLVLGMIGPESRAA
jgi:AcrR family transcriptional regulator